MLKLIGDNKTTRDVVMMTLDKKIVVVKIILLGLFMGGCSNTVKVYSGPDLPRNQISVINAHKQTGQSASMLIRRVNGVETMEGSNANIQVVPGKQTLRVELHKTGSSSDSFSDMRSINTLSFFTQPGKLYRVYGDIDNGMGRVWIVDSKNNPVAFADMASLYHWENQNQ
jgi:hypothetical protein